MSNRKWSESEELILTNNYPHIEDVKKLVEILPDKTHSQIRAKAKTMRLKREYSKSPFKTEELINSRTLICEKCKIEKEYPTEFDKINKGKIKVVNLTCNSCHNNQSTVNCYKNKYGIVLDSFKLFNTYSVIQWWKWTYNEDTPNGKRIRFVPRSLQTKENIAILGQYVINNVICLRTKDEILSLSQKTMEKYKIAFSRTPFILNSSTNLIRLSFPELEFKNWEMKHSGNDFWKDYDNFLDAVKYYYYDIYQKKFTNIDLSKVFSPSFVEREFYKLHRAKEIYYNDVSWQEVMNNIDKNIIVPPSPKEAFDKTILDSIEEKEIYEYVKLSSLGEIFHYIPSSTRDYKFHDSENNCNYIPDFIISGETPTIVEYFGCYDDIKDKEVYEGYKLKTKNKVSYFSRLKGFNFIALYPKDLKYGFKGLREKFNI